MARGSVQIAASSIYRIMIHEIRDITILGGGPTGLFAMFYAGMRGATCQIVDALPELGGQLSALYPEKYIFDVAGFPRVLAKDLVKALADQAMQFTQPVHLAQTVTGLREVDEIRLAAAESSAGVPDGGSAADVEGASAASRRTGATKKCFVLETETDSFPTRTIIIAAGIGAFSPRKLPQPVAAQWYGRGIYDRVLSPEEFRERKVLIIGGGDSAFDWAQQLMMRDARVTLVHRSDRFRAHAATVAMVSAAVAAGRAQMLTYHELFDIHPENGGGNISAVTLRDIRNKTTSRVEVEVILPMLGFVSDIGPLADWALRLEKDEIVVNSLMETGRAGIYAAGDVTTYPGKLKLIATGFAEAATAVNQAVHWIYPAKKVAPGHSSNMSMFGQTDD
jgi:thioredoxin reductase (NADPH)